MFFYNLSVYYRFCGFSFLDAGCCELEHLMGNIIMNMLNWAMLILHINAFTVIDNAVINYIAGHKLKMNT